MVGIEASPGEFPPQIEGTGRYLIHASPALYPLRSDLGLLGGGGEKLMVRLDPGAHDPDAFVAELESLGAGEGEGALTVQRDLATAVDRSLHTQAVALRLLALLAAVASALISWQLLARLTFLESTDPPGPGRPGHGPAGAVRSGPGPGRHGRLRRGAGRGRGGGRGLAAVPDRSGPHG